ncbi:hypothetical protein L7F22_022106 [Adiantum nelumboides]|nr:hypothetical protein [Adiantum nelumboides]
MASAVARSSALAFAVQWRDASTGAQNHLTLCVENFYSRGRVCITRAPSSFFGNKLRRNATLAPQVQRKNFISMSSLVEANDVVILEELSDSKSISDFIRFCDNGDQGLNLQTATISYGRPFPFSLLQPNMQVDLVSAVHIADKEVLYEMVADKDPRQTNRNPRTRWRPSRRLPGGRKRKFSFFGLMQRALAFVLKLDFQLECLDYRKENWYHADLDYKTFSTLQLARGESFYSFARDMALVSFKNLIRATGIPEDVDPWRARLLWVSKALPMPLIGLLVIERVCAPPDTSFNQLPEVKALLDLDISAAIKVFLAKQIATDFTEGAASMVEKSVIIGERNRAAMEELREAFRDGCKRVAIFYGGGHMPDMDRRLREQFGLVPKKVEWQTAWAIRNTRPLPCIDCGCARGARCLHIISTASHRFAIIISSSSSSSSSYSWTCSCLSWTTGSPATLPADQTSRPSPVVSSPPSNLAGGPSPATNRPAALVRLEAGAHTCFISIDEKEEEEEEEVTAAADVDNMARMIALVVMAVVLVALIAGAHEVHAASTLSRRHLIDSQSAAGAAAATNGRASGTTGGAATPVADKPSRPGPVAGSPPPSNPAGGPSPAANRRSWPNPSWWRFSS